MLETAVLLLVAIALTLLTLTVVNLRRATRVLVEVVNQVKQKNEALTEEIEILRLRVEDLNQRISILEDLRLSQLRREATGSANTSSNTKTSRVQDPKLIDLKILALYQKGYSLRQIAKEVGLSHVAIYKRLKKILRDIESSST